MRRNTSFSALSGALVLGSTILAACTDQPTAPLTPEPRANVSVSVSNAEHAALDSITHAVALAMNDAGLRQQIKKDMRASLFTVEHKLEFARYLRGASGGILLAKMAKHSGRTHDQMLALLGRVRSLEFYMPVDAHRENWTGGDNLVVASLLKDGEVPTAYTLAGQPVKVPVGGAPELPTLVITGSETDFSAPLDARKVKNSKDRDGATIGTMVIVPGEECDPREPMTCEDTPTPATYPAGVYLQSATIDDLGENDLRGDPEIEFMVIGPTYHPESQGEKISCSGQGASGVKFYNQENATWSASPLTVEAQILSRTEVENFYNVYNAPYGFQVWEDDDTPCDIVFSGRTQLEQLYDNLMSAQRFTTVLTSIFTLPSLGSEIRLSGRPGYALRAALAGAFQSDDDFIGNVVYTPGTEATGQYGDTFVNADLSRRTTNIFTGTSVTSNGTVRLRTVSQAHP